MIKANTATNLCIRCKLFASNLSSLYCANCDETHKPAPKEFTFCKLGECHAEATKDGLCIAHSIASKPRPAAATNVMKANTQLSYDSESESESDYEPPTKPTRYSHCQICKTPVRGKLNPWLGLCRNHQPKDENTKRCGWEKRFCKVKPRGFWTLYCSRHDKKKMQIHNEASKRSQTKPAIRGDIDVEAEEWMKNNIDSDDEVF